MSRRATTATRRKKRRHENARASWQSAFLEALAKTNNISRACAAVHIGSRTLERTRVYREKERNPSFRKKCEEIRRVYVDDLEEAFQDRALHGWLEPVYYQGAQCGEIRKYSDALQIFGLKKLRPEIHGDDAIADAPHAEREYAERVRRMMREIRSLRSEQAELGESA